MPQGQRPGREQIMSNLFAILQNSIKTSFTADVANGSNVLSNPSTLANLFVGLPVIGPGIPSSSVLTNLAPLTMSSNATADGPASALTTGFMTSSRRFRHWRQVPSQPALFLRDAEEDISYDMTLLPKQVITPQLWLYTNVGQNPDAVPAITLNNILDAIEGPTGVMRPDNVMTRKFTIGGLVEWCRIVGKIDKESGDAAGQAVAVADIEIIVP